MKLYELFKRCLYIPYFQTGKSANYATEIKDDVLYLYFENLEIILKRGVFEVVTKTFTAEPFLINFLY